MDTHDILKVWDQHKQRHVPATVVTRTERFLKGPVPLWWLQKASSLGKGPLAVGLALWFQHGLTRKNPVRLSNMVVVPWGVSRYAKYRALGKLEATGLVRVENKGNQSPEVEIVTERG